MSPKARGRLRAVLQILLPVLVIAAGAGAAFYLVRTRDVATTQDVVRTPPLIEVLTVSTAPHVLRVPADGIVRAHTSTVLVAEVSGRVLEVAPTLAEGSFFDAGDPLVRIEDRDYELARVRASAAVAEAQVALDIERAEAETAVEEWKIHSSAEPTPLVRRLPQVAAAQARLAAAEADLERAALDLERTVIRAPYAGRVRTKTVDIGQYVNRGTSLAAVYAVDFAEVRLPLQDRDLAFLDLPLGFRGSDRPPEELPEVEIRADFAGRSHAWTGRVVRTEGEIDPRSRMVHAIARIEDPYGRAPADSDSTRPPLLVGMYVEATLRGRAIEQAMLIPRSAVRGANTVLTVDDEDRIHSRDVTVTRIEGESVIVGAGLEPGERLCVTRLEVFSEGMKVRVAGPDPTGPGSRSEDGLSTPRSLPGKGQDR